MGNVLRRLFVGWSLERKSFLFFGLALVVPIGLAFWFVLEIVADRLVMQTTRQAARDYARACVAWYHVENMEEESILPGEGSPTLFTKDVMAAMRKHLVDSPEYSTSQFLTLDSAQQYELLARAVPPANEHERDLLLSLEEEYRKQLRALEEATQRATEEDNAESTALPSDELRGLQRQLEQLYKDDGPYLPSDENDEFSDKPTFVNTPPGGWYVYYHAVSFPDSCLSCHGKYKDSQAETHPFRAVRVLVPYSQTQVASTSTLAIMIAIAMVTLAATLFVIHWVLRRLVLNPLQHLHSVSDEIGRGNMDLRANLDTGDEFNALADSFNRMLRNITEGRVELESLNKKLDLKVDQLAQANLSLYEANRLKSDFLANMTHELRTPLNSIIGFSEVLGEIQQLSDKQKKYAANIQDSGKMLLEMINEILDLAKIEAGKMQVTPSSFAIKDLVSGQCDLLQPLVDDKNVDLQAHCDQDLPDVFQDKPKLQQILTNLLSNAIKFTPDGGLITVYARSAPNSEFELTIEDTGVGIPESDFEIIFEKFRQSDAVLQNDGLTRQYAGTGLGLSIVKELCRLLGGEIRLTSQLGTGSTFSVFLPTHYEAGDMKELIGES